MGKSQSPGWRQHRILASTLDVGIFLSPIAAASLTLWTLVGAVRGVPMVWRLALLLVLSTAAAFLVERVVRKLLPLSALLRLTMVFPDRAPSRFAVARQAGSPRELMALVDSPNTDESLAAQNILALVGALGAHDRKTRGHSERVRAYTDLLSEALGLDAAARDRLRWSALLHDIGKLRIDVNILNSPRKPTKRQWDALRTHPQHGRDLAAPLLPWLGEWGNAIVEHHERYDGAGYPNRLAGQQISLGARIIAVVDSFETMTAVRPYKKAISHRAAREELARCAGSQFDPDMVRAFLAVSLPRVLWAMGPFSAALQLPYLSSLQFAGSRAIGLTGTAASAVSAPLLVAGVATAVAAPAALATPTHTHDLATAHHHPGPAAGPNARWPLDPPTPVRPGQRPPRSLTARRSQPPTVHPGIPVPQPKSTKTSKPVNTPWTGHRPTPQSPRRPPSRSTPTPPRPTKTPSPRTPPSPRRPPSQSRPQNPRRPPSQSRPRSLKAPRRGDLGPCESLTSLKLAIPYSHGYSP